EVSGGAAYARYQVTPRVALSCRMEYLFDSRGLFSGVNQALKETTATFDYKIADGFLMRYEWRRDFSNQAFFQTDTFTGRSRQQNTATVGLVGWLRQEQGAGEGLGKGGAPRLAQKVAAQTSASQDFRPENAGENPRVEHSIA